MSAVLDVHVRKNHCINIKNIEVEVKGRFTYLRHLLYKAMVSVVTSHSESRLFFQAIHVPLKFAGTHYMIAIGYSRFNERHRTRA